MQFETSTLPGGVTQISLNGRLDISGVQAIDQPFSFATTLRAERIIVDLAGVSFLSSIGIRLLLTSAKAQAQRGGKLVLASPQPLVRQVLEVAGIDQLVPLCATSQAALAVFAE
jgi:anti-anti-sigma factor